MKLQLDPTKEYALALEGGGARGAYQIGAWKALREAGIKIRAVAGTSVGALNGALIAMGDLEAAEKIWSEIRYSQVMDVDDETMHRLMSGDLRGIDLKTAAESLIELLNNRGLDVSPLYEWVKSVADEKKIRASDVELFIVTYSLSDRKELELRARDLDDGEIHDMLLASAYLPVFKNEPLGGKRYTDGGVADVLPLHALTSNGYRDIIAVRLHGFGVERRIKLPKDASVYNVRPVDDLGSTLDFDAERSQFNLKAGYFDAMRLLYGLSGKDWYIDNDWTEERSYAYLSDTVRRYMSAEGKAVSLRTLHEKTLPQLSKRLSAGKENYGELLTAAVEAAAEEAGIDRWHIYSMDELTDAIHRRFGAETMPRVIADALAPRRLLGIDNLPIDLNLDLSLDLGKERKTDEKK